MTKRAFTLKNPDGPHPTAVYKGTGIVIEIGMVVAVFIGVGVVIRRVVAIAIGTGRKR